MSRATAITNARIFDGERAISDTTVVVGGARIEAVGPSVPRDAVVVDGRGATLMPGLIDSHVHTDMDGHDALKFGVTTELEMMGRWSARAQGDGRKERCGRPAFRGNGRHPEGGPPYRVHEVEQQPVHPVLLSVPVRLDSGRGGTIRVQAVSRGADYIKVFIEDGS